MRILTNVLNKYGLSGIQKPLHLAVSQSFVAILFVVIDFIFSKELSVSDFGAWKEIFFFLNLGVPLLAFGLPEGYKFFIAKDKEYNSYLKAATTFLLALSVTLFLLLGVVHLLSMAGLFSMGMYYGYSLLFPLPLFAFLLNKTLRFTYVNMGWEEKLTKLSFISTLLSLGIIAIGVAVIREHTHLIVLVAVAFYFFIFMLPALFYLRPFAKTMFQFSWNKQRIRNIILYGFPLYLASFIGVFSNNLDKLIVNFTSSDAVFAIFAAGAFEIPLFAMVSAAFAQQTFPKIVQLVQEDNIPAAKLLWIETSKKVSLITYPMILVALFFAEELIFFIYSDAYQESVLLFKTYLLIGLFRNNSYGVLLAANEETKTVTKITLWLLAINVVVSISLFYYFGLIGIVVGTLFTNLCMWISYTVKENLWRYYPNVFFKSKFIAILLILIILTYVYA